MDPLIKLNQPIDVIASFKRTGNSVKVMPLRMRYGSRDIAFTQLGLCHPVRHGSQLHYIFDVSDGCNDYSLDLDVSTLTWTLVAVIDGGNL